MREIAWGIKGEGVAMDVPRPTPDDFERSAEHDYNYGSEPYHWIRIAERARELIATALPILEACDESLSFDDEVRALIAEMRLYPRAIHKQTQ